MITRIARREGNIREEREFLYRRLRREPYNPKTIVHLIRIARMKNDKVEVGMLTKMLSDIQPISQRQIREAISISANNKDSSTSGILIDILNRFINEQGGEIGLSSSITEEQDIKFEREMTEIVEEEQTPIQRARRLIYEGKDMLSGAEEIQKLLEGQDETDVALVVAELYVQAGMRERAQKHLKAYKNTLDINTQSGEIRRVNKVIELARNTKALPYKWEEFWKYNVEKSDKKLESIQEFPSALGEEDGGR